MIKTDIIIIGAGPVGLFAVFEAGLLKMKCHLIDILPKPGGQCIELYPKKPIYDIPAYPEILAGDLIDNLLKQNSQFKPGFTLGEKAEKLIKNNDGSFNVITDKGTVHNAPIVVIAGGLGGFQPRKPTFDGIQKFEDKDPSGLNPTLEQNMIKGKLHGMKMYYWGDVRWQENYKKGVIQWKIKKYLICVKI